MIDVLIRDARPVDAIAVRHIAFTTLNEYRVPADPDGSDADIMCFGECVDNRTRHFVAEVESCVVGSVIVTVGDDLRGKVSKLFVRAQSRRNGIGRQLLAEAIAASRHLDCKVLEINTRRRYREAIALYEATGWERGPDRTGPGPTVVYHLQLDESVHGDRAVGMKAAAA